MIPQNLIPPRGFVNTSAMLSLVATCSKVSAPDAIASLVLRKEMATCFFWRDDLNAVALVTHPSLAPNILLGLVYRHPNRAQEEPEPNYGFRARARSIKLCAERAGFYRRLALRFGHDRRVAEERDEARARSPGLAIVAVVCVDIHGQGKFLSLRLGSPHAQLLKRVRELLVEFCALRGALLLLELMVIGVDHHR